MSINRVIISGNLTRDPELRSTANGMGILHFSVAVNDRRKDASTGEWSDYANYIDCTMFGARAESLSRILTKGMKVSIEGKLRWSQWEKDGQKRSKIEVIVDELELMTSRNGNGSANGGGYTPQQAYASQQTNSYAAPTYNAPAPVIDTSASVYDEDIPF